MMNRSVVRMLVSARNSILREPLGFFLGLINNSILKRTLTVFTYHDISNNPSEFSRNHNLNVPPSLFEYQIKFIKERFNIISPDDLLECRVPDKAALITFDDGFKSFFRNAVPILEQYKIPAIVFLNMEPVKGSVFWAGLITYLCEKRPDFVRYLDENPSSQHPAGSLHLRCSKEVVEAYLKTLDNPVESKVKEFVGEFCTEEDLDLVADKDSICFGNHLFNHHVPILMSDETLVGSYSDNREALSKYHNYREMFSFPFGQPNTCFTEAQVQLLLNVGAQRVFSSHPIVNPDINSPYLDRVPMTSRENSSAKMWAQILLPSARDRLRRNK